jgi:hypothetical protein
MPESDEVAWTPTPSKVVDPVIVPLMVNNVAGIAPAGLIAVGGPSYGKAGAERVGGSVAGDVAGLVSVAGAVAGAMAGVGVWVTVVEPIGPGTGSVGLAPRTVEVSPALTSRLTRTDAPRRVQRDDAILSPLFPGPVDALKHPRARTANRMVGSFRG